MAVMKMMTMIIAGEEKSMETTDGGDMAGGVRTKTMIMTVEGADGENMMMTNQ